jgi:hypothetical protein
VWTVREYDVGEFRTKARVAALDLHDAEWETYRPLPDKSRAWKMTIKALCSGMSGSSDEGKLIDAWAEAATFWSPVDGAGELGVTRPDASAATISRKLLANALPVPQFRLRSGDPGGVDSPGAYPVTGNPYLIYTVQGDTRFPYWVGQSLLTLDTSVAAAELAIGASPDTVTINNPGARWCGLKLTVKAGSVAGNVDGFTVTNTTNGTFVTITNASHMVALEYLDWHASGPITHPLPGADMSSAWRYGALGNNLKIDTGDNVLSVTRDSGAGTCTLSLSWPSYFLSF